MDQTSFPDIQCVLNLGLRLGGLGKNGQGITPEWIQWMDKWVEHSGITISVPIPGLLTLT